MSYNGAGVFVINTSGQPVVAATTISPTVFNALTADLATGLSTAITKDGQTTPTANLPMGGFKLTGMAAGSAATDSARLGQVQSSAATLVTVSGTNTITGTLSPTLTAYAVGQRFSFVAAATNTAAVTLNIDSLGAKAITRDGAVAMNAGDLVIGEVVTVIYDGTQFQTADSNSHTMLLLNGTTTSPRTTSNGLASITDPSWSVSGAGPAYTYNNHINQVVGQVNVSGGTVAQRWNTSNSMSFQSGTANALMANSHLLSNTVALYIAAGSGDGGGGAFDGNGVPTNANYMEIGSLSYSAVILSPGHYNEGVASYFYDYTGAGAGVAAISVNFFCGMYKNATANTYLTYGYQAYSAGTQQTTYAPTAAYRIDGGWQSGLNLSGLAYGPGILDTGTHPYAIDLNGGTFSGGAIRLGNNSTIVARNSGGSADVALLNFNVSSLYMGGSGVTAIFANASTVFAPILDNTIPLGQGANRWTAVWAVNGTIQTSDPSLKTNISALPDAMPLVLAIQPATYSWIVGGKDYQDVWEEQEVQDTEIEEYEEEEVAIVAGVAVMKTIPKTREVLRWDVHNVVDADSNPVMVQRRGHTIQKTYQTPVMVKKSVLVRRSIEKPGKRTHWGFLADNVQAVMATSGRDFGGYVEDENGTKHLRPDQLVPVLWKAVQELEARLAVIEAQKQC